MKIKLEDLINLQECDALLKGNLRKKEEGPLRINMLEEKLNTIEMEVETRQKQLEALKRERRESEHGIEDVENKIEKSNVKLNSIKSNKEYTAALKEINDLQREQSLLEDQVLELMEKIELDEKSVEEAKIKRDREKKIIEQDRKKILDEVKELEKHIAGLNKNREELCLLIDKDLLKTYDAISSHKQGLAVSPVIKKICQACHMGIPPQKFNELIRGDSLMNCPNCGRIIYWGEDERYQSGEKPEEEGVSE